MLPYAKKYLNEIHVQAILVLVVILQYTGLIKADPVE